METTITFKKAHGSNSYSGFFQLKNPTAEQIARLNTLEIHSCGNVKFDIPAALTVLLGISPDHRVIIESSENLNNYMSVIDDGSACLSFGADEGEIIHNWLSAGAPATWDGKPGVDPEPRKQLARDAAGRFSRI